MVICPLVLTWYETEDERLKTESRRQTTGDKRQKQNTECVLRMRNGVTRAASAESVIIIICYPAYIKLSQER